MIKKPKPLRHAWHLYHPRGSAVGPDGRIVVRTVLTFPWYQHGRDAGATTSETWDMGSTCHVSPNAENKWKEMYRPLLEYPKLKKIDLVLLAV